MTASYQASVAECKEDSFKLAIGIAFRKIEVFPLPTGEINVSGQPYRDARELMYWAEDAELDGAGHNIVVDSGTYALLESETRSRYLKWAGIRPNRLADVVGDVYVGVVPWCGVTG